MTNPAYRQLARVVKAYAKKPKQQSAVKSYDYRDGILTIYFNSSGSKGYDYNVTQEEYEDFVQAKHKGAWLRSFQS